ncbi:MAG: DUF4349 domain-containing protein [Anaerolineae bacterium]|nr:DUF4349 domain-containing protein [Anaerolineae bacterium]
MQRSLWILVPVILTLTMGGCRIGAAPTSAPMEPLSTPPAYDVKAEEVLGAEFRAALAPTVERMVIRNATLDLVVRDTRRALGEIEKLAKDLGGYITSLNTYQHERGETASVTLRVPADQLDVALERLRGLATTVRQESIFGKDVTEEFVDLESRLRHLEAKEKQLLEFLEKAEDTEAVLAVYEHLSRTQAEIEQVKGRMRFLENQAALATITVNLTPDVLAQPLETGGWNLPKTIRNAIQTLLRVLEFLVKALIYLVIVILPVLLLLALFGFGLYRLVRVLVRLAFRRK